MWVRGAKGTYDRETGLITELEERNIYYNPSLNHSLFDANLYGLVKIPLNLTAGEIGIRFDATWGAEDIHLLSVDIIG